MIYSLILSSYGFHNVQCISMFWKWWIQSYFASKAWRISYWTSVGWSKSLGLVTSLLPKDWGILRKHKKKKLLQKHVEKQCFLSSFLCFVILAWSSEKENIFPSCNLCWDDYNARIRAYYRCHSCFFFFLSFFSPSDLSMLNSVQMHKLVISVSKSLFDFVLFLL